MTSKHRLCIMKVGTCFEQALSRLLTIVSDKRLCGILESCVESLDDAGLHLVVRVAILGADEGCKLSSLLPHRPMVLNSTALQQTSSL